MKPIRVLVTVLFVCALIITFAAFGEDKAVKAGEEAHGTRSYDEYKKPMFCGTSCHVDIYRQWQQAMMSQAYTHHWDEIEYFQLAVPHAEKDEVVAGVKDGCNGCHAPISFLAGDTPPPKPSEGSRANESVSCEVCHTAKGFKGDQPYNFNFISSPGQVKYGSRGGTKSPEHDTVKSEFIRSAELCGTCHNEMSPYNIWVKSTHLEWKEGPYAEEGVKCHTCHMTYSKGRTASMGKVYEDAAQHLFHGAHDEWKIKGTIEVRIHPDIVEAEPGDTVKFTCVLFNQKTGHKFPTGSVEDRIVWLHVEAKDEAGNTYHLKVDKKGFEGEEYTISTDTLAYQDMGIALDKPDFKGVQRDAVPFGDRIFRMPYFDPQGRMTIQQWNTKSLGVDYRFAPRETKIETFTYTLPYEVAPGKLEVTATVYYSRLVKSVGEFLKVPAEEYEPVKVGEHITSVTIFD